MRLTLTRHGETEENLKKIFQGHSHGTLTKKGIEQAEKLGDRLKEEKYDVIYSSDLARTADTAKIIAEHHPDTPLLFVKELREMDLGPYTGKEEFEITTKNKPETMESEDSIRKRAKSIIDEAYEKYPEGNVLFVSHNTIQKVLISVIMNKPISHIDKIERPKNTSVTIFEIDEDKNHKIHVWDCDEHLNH